MQVFSNQVSVKVPHNICICGAGAVGSFLAYVLSRVCRNVILIDPDGFEPHNVATHFVSVHSLTFGQKTPKVEAVKKTIDSFMPSAILHVYQQPAESIAPDATIDSTDVFILATDSIASRRQIAQHLQQFNKQIIDVGISHDGYNITVIPHEQIPGYIDFLGNYSEREEDHQRACQDVRNLPVIVSLTAELLKVLTDLQGEGDRNE